MLYFYTANGDFKSEEKFTDLNKEMLPISELLKLIKPFYDEVKDLTINIFNSNFVKNIKYIGTPISYSNYSNLIIFQFNVLIWL